MHKNNETFRLEVEELPELDTEVAISGSSKHEEVGGGACIGIIAGIAIYYSL